MAELSPEIVLYFGVVDQGEADAFIKKHCKQPKSINEINVGDEVVYEHPTKMKEQNMIFLGKNVEGKYILHTPG